MRRFSLFALVYILAVILFGAYVRISGSGAGCGEHWPSCEGEVFPSDLMKNHAKTIEFTHRATSGLSGLVVIILLIGAFAKKPVSPPTRKFATAAFVLIVTEGLLGASLVLFRWVGLDASFGRGIMMPLHLGNTYLLLTALALTIRAFTSPGDTFKFTEIRSVRVGASLLFVTGMFGALAALGDTLFPGTRGFITEGHTYLKLRNLHPFIALLTVGHILAISVRNRDRFNHRQLLGYHLCDVVAFMTGLQALIGILNIFLSAPAYMQIAHLLISDLLWLVYMHWLFENHTNESLRAGSVT
jgi:heme a synthase